MGTTKNGCRENIAHVCSVLALQPERFVEQLWLVWLTPVVRVIMTACEAHQLWNYSFNLIIIVNMLLPSHKSVSM